MGKSDRGLRLATLALMIALLAPRPLQTSSLADGSPDEGDAAQRMDRFVSSKDFSGVVLVGRDGRVIFQRAYGMASREHSVPNKLETKFRIGSVTKSFTAMAIMILVERGKLHLTDPLCNYIDDCPKAWAGITVRHLLSHTSGIPNFTEFPDNDHYERLPMTPVATIARFRDLPLEFVPGERFSYDDSGYLLLGYVVERASGKRYEDFMRENIYEPLGMLDSGYDHPWVILKNRAGGYEKKDGQTVNAMLMEMDTPFGGGSMYSTVEDLLRWDQALYTEKLVSRKSLDQMFTPFHGRYVPVEPWQRGLYSRHQWGYGCWITKWFGHDLIWIPGFIHGFVAAILRYPEDRTVVIVLENIEPNAEGVTDPDLEMEPMTVANGLSAIAFGLSPDSNPVATTTSGATRRK